jgi:hypothetical protein
LAFAGRAFNGTTDIIIAPGIGNNVDISTGPMTVSFWIYPTVNNTTAKFLVSHGQIGVTGSQWVIMLGGLIEGNPVSSAISWEVGCCGNISGVYGSCGAAPTLNHWTHIALFVDPAGKYSGSSPSAGLYMNGVGCQNQAFREKRLAGGQNVTMGGLVTTASYSGSIAEVGVWNDILSLAEITALESGVPPPQIRDASLVGYWPLWGASSPEAELSGHKINGVLTGTTAANHCPCSPVK